MPGGDSHFVGKGAAPYSLCRLHHFYKNSNGVDESYIMYQLMYKVIMPCANINIKATEKNFRDNLTALHMYMALIKSNIPAYNKYFDKNHSHFFPRGCNFDAMVLALFSGYLSAEDFVFTLYMQRLHEDHIDECKGMDKLDHTKIISMALNN